MVWLGEKFAHKWKLSHYPFTTESQVKFLIPHKDKQNDSVQK